MAISLSQNPAVREFLYRIANSRFFMVALLLHLLLIISVGTKALFDQFHDEPDIIATNPGSFVSTDPNPAPPPPPQQQQPKTQFQVQPTQAAASQPAAMSAIATMSTATTSFSVPSVLTPSPTRSTALPTQVQTAVNASTNMKPGQIDKQTLAGIAGFTSGWAQPGGGGGTLKDRKFKFTAYLAKYSGGDWYSSVWKDGSDRILGGSLPNLLYLMRKVSQDKIDAKPDAEPLDLASDKIFTVKPPFIFFTGHRDFVLTDKEVENLQRYIRLGGAIWGDSSLPGQRSRFDIAFRREMKRVIPDIDKQFEALPQDHPIYARPYFPEIVGVPSGINFYREPVYALKFNGEIAVLYTANDYGDMWQFGLDPRWKFDLSKDKNGRYIAINGGMWRMRDIYYRGVTEENVALTFKFGTNIVIHLLTRWEDKVRSVRAM
ncbi:MAG TPA: DUF4159 domain-containing protein [Chthoniobacterales bacterium]